MSAPYLPRSQKLPVHVNGAFKGEILSTEAPDRITALEVAVSDAAIQPFVLGKRIIRTVLLPGKLFHITVR
jgi:hypothetical protein